MYTKNIVELEEAFNRIAKKWEVNVIYGITNSRFKLEDGLPWLEVEGKFNKTSAKKFIQELASELDIKMLFNRVENSSTGVVYGVFDVNPEFESETEVLKAFSDEDGMEEFMEDYGTVFKPK